ncbi:glucokinase [Candidatus Woesearchaeota archaeon]|nr:glucokinase [Candidatus Woesearchaeota archaeon]
MDFTVRYHSRAPRRSKGSIVLGADIGGTHTNIAIARVEQQSVRLLFSCHFKSKNIPGIEGAISTTLGIAAKKYAIHPTRGCIAAAGVVADNHDFCRITNLPWNADARELSKKTKLKQVVIINDFEALGYALNLSKTSERVICIKQGKRVQYATKAILGAGTGLGKTIVPYQKASGLYVPLPSEGGHADLPLFNPIDQQLAGFLKQQYNLDRVSYTDVLSGSGIEHLYAFVKTMPDFSPIRFTDTIDHSDEKPARIAEYKTKDTACRLVFKLFAAYYGRCAKNLALDTLCFGGLYIAGGIAIKNKGIFKSSQFMHEFNASDKMQDVLHRIPIYLLTDYDISMLGACYAASKHVSTP